MLGLPRRSRVPEGKPLVTVGVTSFQNEQHIGRALDSVRQQTLASENIEVLVADDGSRDGTAKAARTFAERASWAGFEVRSHKNTGTPSTGRNSILQHGRGEYVFFLDADDYLGDQALEAMTRAATSRKADIVTGRYEGVNRSAPNILPPKDPNHGGGYHAGWLNSLHVQKLFRMEYLRGLPYRFNETLIYASDHPFMLSAFLHAARSVQVDEVPCYFITLEEEDPASRRRRRHVSRAEIPAAQQLKFLHDCFGILALGRGQGGETAKRAGRMRAEYWNRLLKLHFPMLVLRKRTAPEAGALGREVVYIAELYGAESGRSTLVPGAKKMLDAMRTGDGDHIMSTAHQVREEAHQLGTVGPGVQL